MSQENVEVVRRIQDVAQAYILLVASPRVYRADPRQKRVGGNPTPKRRLAPLAAKAWTRDLFATAVIPRQTERTTPCMDPP
jgi:hypothetical protein